LPQPKDSIASHEKRPDRCIGDSIPGNMLRAGSRTVEAEAALRAATPASPARVEAWYNLADLLDDQGRSEAAI
jgi:predicted Zn-dependent protease